MPMNETLKAIVSVLDDGPPVGRENPFPLSVMLDSTLELYQSLVNDRS